MPDMEKEAQKMEPAESAGELYVSYKPLLFSLAYRMLGSVMDAEDIVQEAFLYVNETKLDHVQNMKSYLCKLVTNRCIDRLRSASRQREVYVGPWLPEPLVAERDSESEPSLRYLQKESISTAYLLLLLQLSWTERAVFLLREVLQYEYDEIAEIVGKSSTNCRQIFHRAKRAVSGLPDPGDERQPVMPAGRREAHLSTEQTGDLIERFVQALTAGNLAQLMDVLSADAVLYSDGGGKVTAAVRPIQTAERIARFLEGIMHKLAGSLSIRFADVNGQTGLVSYTDGRISSVISFQTRHNRITGIYLVLNPDKLKHVL